MTDELQANIDKAAAAIETCRDEAEAALQSFFDVLASHIRTRIPSVIERAVTENPAVTKTLGARLTELKLGIPALSAEVPARVREWLDDDKLWWHRKSSQKRDLNNPPRPDYHTEAYDRRDGGPASLRSSISKGLAALIPTYMAKYGYSQVSGYGPKWEGELDNAMNAYAAAYNRFMDARYALARAQSIKETSDAKALWDKA